MSTTAVSDPAREVSAPSAPARRVPWYLTVVAWAALVVFTIGAVGTALIGQSVFLSTQTIERYAPWTALDTAPPTPSPNQFLGDTIDSNAPRLLLHQRSLDDGDFAQWNPYIAGGTAGLSVPDSGPFSPLSIPWYLFPETYAPGMVKVLEIAAVTLGFSLLLRRFRLPSAAWALAALIYSSSAFMVAWTNWQQTKVASLIPLLFWAIDKAVIGRRWRDVAPLAVVTAGMLAGGFPAITGFAGYAATAYAIARTLSVTREPRVVLRAAVTAASGFIAGATLWAWQLLPFASHAINVVDFDVRQEDATRHLGLEPLATTLVPSIYGGPVGQHWSPRWNPIESFSYIGAATIALVVVALVVRHRAHDRRFLTRFSLAALLVTAVLVYGGGPPLALVQNLPIFSNNMIGRATVLVGFFAALTAAVTFGGLLEPHGARDAGAERTEPPRTGTAVVRGRRLAAAIALAVALLAGLGALVVGAIDLAPAEHRDAVVEASVVAAALLVLALAVSLARATRPTTWTRAGAAIVIPTIVALPAVGVATDWWPKGPTEYFYPRTPTHAFLEANLGQDRFISVNQAMLPGSSTAYGLRAANGHGWHTTEWKDLLRLADPDVMSSPTYSTLKSQEALAAHALDRMAVRYAVAGPNALLPGTIEVLRTSDEVTLLEPDRPATARATTPFRGAVLTIPEEWDVGGDGAIIEASVETLEGEPIADTRLAVENDWPAAQMWIPLAAEHEPGTPVEIEVTVVSDEEPLAVAGDSADDLAIEVMRPLDDGLRLVHTDGALVLERLTALDRVRWAGREVVVEDDEEVLDLIADGGPGQDTVIIEDPDDAISPTGSSAQVTVLADTTDVLEAEVVADGPGWLVVADSLRGATGWTAYVDGEEVPLAEADHAMGAIAVPAGHHHVALKYTAPGLHAGLAVSALTVLALALPYVPRRARALLPGRRTA